MVIRGVGLRIRRRSSRLASAAMTLSMAIGPARADVHVRLSCRIERAALLPGETSLRNAADRTVELLRRRMAGRGIADGRVFREGEGDIVVELTEAESRTFELFVADPPRLEVRSVLEPAQPLGSAEILAAAEDNPNKRAWRVERTALASNPDIEQVRTQVDPESLRIVVTLQLSAQAARRFDRADRAERSMAVVLQGRVLAAPILSTEAASGTIRFSGDFAGRTLRLLETLPRRVEPPVAFEWCSKDVFSGPWKPGMTIDDAIREMEK